MSKVDLTNYEYDEMMRFLFLWRCNLPREADPEFPKLMHTLY